MSHPLILSRERLIRSVCVADPAVSDAPPGKSYTDDEGVEHQPSPSRWVRASRCTVKPGALVASWRPLAHSRVLSLQSAEDRTQMLLDASEAVESIEGPDGIESVEDLRLTARVMLGAHIFSECSLAADPTEPTESTP